MEFSPLSYSPVVSTINQSALYFRSTQAYPLKTLLPPTWVISNSKSSVVGSRSTFEADNRISIALSIVDDDLIQDIMTFTKRARSDDNLKHEVFSNASEHNEKRRKLEGNYSFQYLGMWVLSKVQSLPCLFRKTKKQDQICIDFCSESSTISQSSSKPWLVVNRQPAFADVPQTIPHGLHNSSARRKRRATQPRARSVHNLIPTKTWFAPEIVSVPANVTIDQHEKMDARLTEVSERLEDLVKTGQEALRRSASDFSSPT